MSTSGPLNTTEAGRIDHHANSATKRITNHMMVLVYENTCKKLNKVERERERVVRMMNTAAELMSNWVAADSAAVTNTHTEMAVTNALTVTNTWRA